MVISNYEITEKIAEAPQAAVFKAYNKKDPARPLVLKILKAGGLSESKKARFRQKIEHLKVLNDPELITPLSFGEKEDLGFITRDFFDGVPLDKLISAAAHGLPLPDFFTIACGLASALKKVHGAGIIHGGVKPHNILVAPDTLDIRLVDFVSAFDVREVSHFIYEPFFVRGTLAYTSPEQTGRINHRVAFSSDLYSLGIVFHEMLSGRLPFFSEDPLELIHSHLAGDARPVHELNPAVPVALSRIVAKLMLKQPEKRYQSAAALFADLTRCKEEFAAIGTIREFPLEAGVSAQKITFISKMVGRDREAGIVLEEYEQAAHGSFRSLFISGLPGIGKTRLIQELQKPIVKHRGYFTSGKFDIYQKNIPYSSLVQALKNLIRTFLTESDERVALWKEKILSAVGENGKVLTDVVPELEDLLGSQPGVKPLPPVEALSRFHDLFGRFLGRLADQEHPLTLFLDDLQWCDTATFDFLANVFGNHKDHPYLFFLGAYRHNEVDQSHPLTRLLDKAKDGGLPLREIRLSPLDFGHCREMVSYILDSTPGQTGGLSEFISALSEGNPLFVSESLAYLHNEGLLLFDQDNKWHWSLEKIQNTSMPDTVVGLFSSKIRKLSPELVALLEYCACMGNNFSPSEVSMIREMTLTETFEQLKPALEQGLLMENKNRLQFIHDRVQEAALSDISSERRCQIHRQIGDHLLAAVPEGADFEKLENLFAIVSHLNLGRDENPDSRTAYLLSDMNYHAGNKALDALAIESANEYFNIAKDLLPGDSWENAHYERTYKIFQKAAKTELMCGRYENSEGLINYLLDHAKTDLDKTEALAEQTVSLSSIGNFPKAIETANRGLAYFGKAIPADLDEVRRRRKELIAEINATDIDIRQILLNMPFTTDRKMKVESAFYSELLADLYFSGRVEELYFVGAQATLHALAGGMDEAVIYAFTEMGLYHGTQEEFERSFLYEDLTHDLAAKYPNTFAATKCMNGATWTMMHTRSHPRDVIAYSLKAFQYGKNCGDINNAAIAFAPVMWNLQVQGADLPAIEKYAGECLQFAGKYHVTNASRLADATLAGWVSPMKKDYSVALMGETLAEWEREKHFAALGSYCLHRALSHYYLGEHEEAATELVRADKYLWGITNSVLQREWHIFHVLNTLKLYENVKSAVSKHELSAKIKPSVAKIEKWTSFGPVFKPYLAFIYAELERVTGEFREARSLYLDAINAAHEEEYTLLEGHIHECFGELLKQTGQKADIYLAEALRLYRTCGAERKEVRLLERYEEELKNLTSLAPPPVATELDVEYLMKSALAISAETEQEKLLSRIMTVVIEGSGAQHGYLILDREGRLFVCAESHITDKESARTCNKRLEDADGIARPIVGYVQRTRGRLILANASQEGMFKDDPEMREMQLRSVLCLPVIKQSKLAGILYLENRLADSVFTPEKTRMMELLASQAAVSLENMGLVERERKARGDLERSNKDLQDFAFVASHDLQEPLRKVVSFGEILKSDFSEALGKEGNDYLGRMIKATGRMQGLIRDLLQLSRVSSGNIAFAPVDLGGVIKEVVSDLEARIKESGGRVQVGQLPTVEADRLQMRQLFQNLLSNALKFRKKEAAPVVIVESAVSGHGYCEVSVADNGIGFEMEYAERIFRPFQRLHGQDAYQGSGIGLTICKKIVERHGGELTVKSAPNEGTTLKIRLPLYQSGKENYCDV